MKNKLAKVVAGALLGLSLALPASGADAATVAMLPLTNPNSTVQDQAAGNLSDLLLEQLIASGKFDFTETKPLATNEVKRFFGEDVTTYVLINQCRATGNYDAVFESSRFDKNYASSIDVAYKGDLVSPEIIKRIGQESGARYLFIGTINNVGEGVGTDYVGQAASAIGQQLAQKIPIAGLLGGISTKKKLVGVHCTLRVVDADTGRVVWLKNAYAQDSATNMQVIAASVGSDEITTDNLHKALEKVSKKLVSSVTEDAELQKLLSGEQAK